MLFDTDILIWILRGNAKAAGFVDGTRDRQISVVTLMELLQGARDGREARLIKGFVADLGFRTLPLTENIGHRAVVYMEGYALSAGLRVADALIAATAAENSLTLCSGDRSHYRAISELVLKPFRP
jgi:predicted nucleic acid-binding protein